MITPLIRQFVKDVATLNVKKKGLGESVGTIRRADDWDWTALEDALLQLNYHLCL